MKADYKIRMKELQHYRASGLWWILFIGDDRALYRVGMDLCLSEAGLRSIEHKLDQTGIYFYRPTKY